MYICILEANFFERTYSKTEERAEQHIGAYRFAILSLQVQHFDLG